MYSLTQFDKLNQTVHFVRIKIEPNLAVLRKVQQILGMILQITDNSFQFSSKHNEVNQVQDLSYMVTY